MKDKDSELENLKEENRRLRKILNLKDKYESEHENIATKSSEHICNEYIKLNSILEQKVIDKTKEKDILLSLFNKGDAVLFKWNNDEHWSIDYVSQSVSNILEYTVDEFINSTITYSRCIHKDDLENVIAEVEDAMRLNKEYFKHEPYRVITKNGNIKWVSDYTVIIKDDDNNVTHFLGYINDITKEKKKDNLLYEQSKLASMGEMIGNIAHQWRQPLSVISTAASGILVEKEFGLLTDEHLYEKCNSISKNAQYLSNTIDDFRDFIKGDREKKSFNLSSTIESFLHLVDGTIKENNIDLVLNLDDNITMNGYESELTQCIINIFNNAKDALIEKSIKHKIISISTKIENNKVLIVIKDNAKGIPNNILPKIFEPYFTTKHQSQGTGLGLNMTYKLIVEGMHGTIDVHNARVKYNDTEYMGAEFIISLDI